MNQQVLFNDDFQYNEAQQYWRFTGILAGARIIVHYKSSNKSLTSSDKFELEAKVEGWLNENEPDESGEIWLG